MNHFFKDGIRSLINGLANKRNATLNNRIESNRISEDELNEIYKTGLANKIIRIKTSSIFKEGFACDDKQTIDIVNKKLLPELKKAITWMLAFGRGIIVINNGDDLSTPLGTVNINKTRFKAFSGYKTKVNTSNTYDSLNTDRYNQPTFYIINGQNIHYSRVMDFTYIQPVEDDKPLYNYGGISELEIIYTQIINDSIIERATSTILEKNSTMFYKIKDFKRMMSNKQEKQILDYVSSIEDVRSIHGAVILDQEDETKVENQSLTNLDSIDTISLRRVALISGIPLSWLVGESVKGLNSTGENESQIFWSMIKTLGNDYIEPILNERLTAIGLSEVKLIDQFQQSPLEKSQYETIVLDNALKMQNLGIDYESYLLDKGLIKQEDIGNSIENEFKEDNVEYE